MKISNTQHNDRLTLSLTANWLNIRDHVMHVSYVVRTNTDIFYQFLQF